MSLFVATGTGWALRRCTQINSRTTMARLTRPRFTVRQMMGLVAVSAALIGAGALVHRHLRLSVRAGHHARVAREQGEMARSLDSLSRAANDPKNAAEIRAVAASHVRLRDWHIRLEEKY